MWNGKVMVTSRITANAAVCLARARRLLSAAQPSFHLIPTSCAVSFIVCILQARTLSSGYTAGRAYCAFSINVDVTFNI